MGKMGGGMGVTKGGERWMVVRGRAERRRGRRRVKGVEGVNERMVAGSGEGW